MLCAVDLYTGYSTVWACETAGEWELALKVLKLIPETRVRVPRNLEKFVASSNADSTLELVGREVLGFEPADLRQNPTSLAARLM